MNKEEYQVAANFWEKKKIKKMPEDELRAVVEEYINNNVVCALATGTGNYVRCTPLEYSFHDGKFWIFTEGGKKFIGLEKNKNVSISIFDKNPNFTELKSVQVQGKAEVVEPMNEAYVAHGNYKKIPIEKLRKMVDEGQPMHLLCITPEKMEVIFSRFKKDGYDFRQTLNL